MQKKYLYLIIICWVALGCVIFYVIDKDENIDKSMEKYVSVQNVDDLQMDEGVINSTDSNVKKQNIKYVNNKYQYEVVFPENWYMDNGSSEKDVATGGEDGLVFGGQTFWSNYSNIDDFSPSNHPDDFHLLAVTVYKDQSRNINEFAKKLNHDEDAKKVDFEVEDIIGKEIISPGLVKGNPRIAIIFKEENLFYVFNLGFVGGDTDVVQSMEDIVRTFKLID